MVEQSLSEIILTPECVLSATLAPLADSSMRMKEISLRQDPDLRKELALLARGCDFVLPSRFKKRLKAFQQGQQAQAKKEEPVTPALSESIPKFYFPRGQPQANINIDNLISKIEKIFSQFPDERVTLKDMGLVAKACECPLYWKAPLFHAAGDRRGYVSVHKFVAMWRKVLQTCHDDASKFLHLLAKPGCNYLEQEDFIPFLQVQFWNRDLPLRTQAHTGQNTLSIDDFSIISFFMYLQNSKSDA